MAIQTITAGAFIARYPSLIINHDGTAVDNAGATIADGVQLNCAATTIDPQIDQEFTDIETFCNEAGEAPGKSKRTINVGIRMSYGAAGIFNLLQPYSNLRVNFAMVPNYSKAVGPDNPEMSGNLWIPEIPMSIGEVGGSPVYDMVLNLDGPPVYAYADVDKVIAHPTGV